MSTTGLAPGTVRPILGFARPYRRALGAFLGLIVVDALAGAAAPLVYRAIIDQGIQQGRTGLVVGLAAVVAGLAVLSAGIGLAQRWYSARIGEGLIHDLRTQVFDHMQRMPIGFFTRAQTGALVTRLNSDVQGAQQAFTSTLSNVVGNVVGVVATLAAMFVLSWQITVLALTLLPLFVLPARWVGSRLADITRERYRLTGEMGQMMTERFNVSGALIVKLFGDPERESRAFDRRAGRVRDIGVTSAMYSRIVMTSLGLLAALATAVVYGLGGAMAIAGTLGIGTLVALTAYLGRLYGPLTSLSNVQVDVMTTLVSFERVLEVLDLQPAIVDAGDPRPIPAGPVTVELDDVHFRYPTAAEVSLASLEGVARLDTAPSEEILHGVSLRVEPGRTLALVGASGAGKSTIAGLVSRLYDPTAGAVRLGGIDLRDSTLADVRATVGVVAQDVHLFHDTLRANLRYARPDATDGELEAALGAAQVWPVIERLPAGLDTVVGDRGYRMSGGEKQRIAIARLLLKDPGVVVLDEATAHLDAGSEAAVQDALAVALEGRTSIVIAHRLATIRHADEIAVIDHGRVVERGTHDELVAAGGVYARLNHTQFATAAWPDPRPTSGPGPSGTRRRPGQQVVGRHRVHDPLQRYITLGRPVAAVGLPFQLTGGVGVGVDREPAAVLDRQVEQRAGRIESLGPAVDLDRRAELGARREHVVGVERRLGPFADQPPRAMTEDVDVGVGDGDHHALGHPRALLTQLGVDAGDDDVETFQQVVVEVEAAVFEDVDLHPGEDAEGGEALVELADLAELAFQAFPVEAVGDRQAGRVVGQHHVLVPEVAGGGRHLLDLGPAVAPRRVEVAVAAQPLPVALPGGCDRHLRRLLEVGQIVRHLPGQGLGDHLGGRVADAVEVGQRAGRGPDRQLVGVGRPHHVAGPVERLGLEAVVVRPVEAVDDAIEGGVGGHPVSVVRAVRREPGSGRGRGTSSRWRRSPTPPWRR